MKNFRHEGRMVSAIAPVAGAVSSEGITIGDLFGVAASSAADGEAFELAVEGVFTLPKDGGAIAQGVKVYWIAANKQVTTTASGNKLIGHAAIAALAGDTSIDVRLSN